MLATVLRHCHHFSSLPRNRLLRFRLKTRPKTQNHGGQRHYKNGMHPDNKEDTKSGRDVACSVCERPYRSRHAMLAHYRRDHPAHDHAGSAELKGLADAVSLKGRVLLLPTDATMELRSLFPEAEVSTCNYHSRAARFSLDLRRPDAFARLLRRTSPDVVVCLRDKKLGLRMRRAKKLTRYMLLKREEAVRLKCDRTYALGHRDDLVWGTWARGS